MRLLLDTHAFLWFVLNDPQLSDPFDRLMVAQAIVESISLVSADAVLDQYPITRL